MSNLNNKFLFDTNNFDEPDEPDEIIEEIVEDLPPPPPTFSEDELEAAKAIAFDQGKKEGGEEERGKRNQIIADELSAIKSSFTTLYASEIYRERTYEQESVQLALKLLEQLSPIVKEKLSFDDLKQTITTTIKNQVKQNTITIEVPEGYSSDIEAHLKTLWVDPDNAPKYTVIENKDLTIGGCKLSWADGGMVRNSDDTAKKIKLELEELLLEGEGSIPTLENNGIKNQEISDHPAATIEPEAPIEQETGEENDGSDR